MGEAKRKRPSPMPSSEAVSRIVEALDVLFIACGCRDTRRVHDPDPELLGNFAVVDGDLSVCDGRKVILFVHGYNVTTSEALKSAEDFFSKVQAGLLRDEVELDDYVFVLFTWPGDVGPLWFDAAQNLAHASGVGLYRLATALRTNGATRVTLVTHSLGVHVGLRSAAILGERRIRKNSPAHYDAVLLLAPAIENDVFRRPKLFDRYHFPESAFGMSWLHIFSSRADDVLKKAFSASEFDRALGYSGPESMKPLKSLSDRSLAVFADPSKRFQFELHDFSPQSATIMNPKLFVHGHSHYWEEQDQVNYYINLMGD